MRKLLTIAALCLAAAPLSAQNWSFGAGAGAFVFGDFIERRMRGPISPDQPSVSTTVTLSAATRAGVAVDLEREFGERWALRFEGAFTSAPLSIKDSSEEGFSLEAGDLDVTTFMAPIVFQINRGGSVRFHLLAGPAYAIYKPSGRTNSDASISVFNGTRSKWGGAAGVGLGWRLSDRFALEGELTDIVTASPFHRDDFPDTPGLKIKKPHNVHTKVGVRYRF
jgi:opacity protein-like surface antigen